MVKLLSLLNILKKWILFGSVSGECLKPHRAHTREREMSLQSSSQGSLADSILTQWLPNMVLILLECTFERILQ